MTTCIIYESFLDYKPKAFALPPSIGMFKKQEGISTLLLTGIEPGQTLLYNVTCTSICT